ncbi:GNAT family N-acetyltransferase [Streptomyces bohaiensis]|uniref:GNAT family N-acetyltransferase n=1 Tax=Streptomyces bohaiensis TaxID=1431344 RepID=UPI003B81967F
MAYFLQRQQAGRGRHLNRHVQHFLHARVTNGGQPAYRGASLGRVPAPPIGNLGASSRQVQRRSLLRQGQRHAALGRGSDRDHELFGLSGRPPRVERPLSRWTHYARQYRPHDLAAPGRRRMEAHARLLQQRRRPHSRALHQEQLAVYGTADDPGATDGTEFEAPDGLFLIARSANGSAIACGGWRTLNNTAAEIKRMYVAPPARGQGLGHLILTTLERDTAGRGFSEILLETGVHNTSALTLYAAAGYEPISSYVPGRNPEINRALRKTLQQPPPCPA